MDVNFLTVADAIAGQAGMVQASSKPEPRGKVPEPSELGGEKQLQANSHESATTDNSLISGQREPVDKAPKEFRQTLLEKQNGDGQPKAQGNAKPKEQPAGSKTAERPDLVQSWLAQNSVPVQNAGGKLATEIEPKAGRKLAELIANFKNEKSTPVTGQAAKSAEVKLLEPSEKVQAGLKTVLPEKSKGLNGLKDGPVAPSKSIPAGQASAHMPDGTGETAASNQKAVAVKVPANTGQATQVPGNADTRPEVAGKKAAVAGILPVADTAKPPVSKKAGDSTAAIHAENGRKSAVTVTKTSVGNTAPAAEATKAPEVLPKSAATESGKPVHAVDAETALNAAGFEKAKETPSIHRKSPAHAVNNATNDPSAAKSNAAEIQVDIGQAKDRGTGSSNNGSYQDIAQMISQSGSETQTANAFSTSGATAKLSDLPAGTSSGDVSADVGKQILESIHSSMSHQAAEKQITIRLNPPELGHVFVKLQEQGAQITGVLEVSKAQTKLEIEQALPEITRNLAASGVQVQRIEVVLSTQGQSTDQGAKDALLQDSSFQQQGSSDYGSAEEDGYETDDAYYGLTNDVAYRNIAEFREMSLSGNSINVLI